jgi:N-methylhydantoinase B
MVGSSALHTQVYTQMFGVDQNGAPYANFPFDGIAGGSGACSFRDGIDHGGGIISTQLRIGNVEEWERVIPFLYLYRREVRSGGGHGHFRGGAGLVTAWTGYRTDESYISSGGVVQAATQGNGLSGGFPGSGGTFWSARETGIRDALAAGTWPSTPAELRELAPHGTLPPAKKFDNPLAEGDLFEVLPPLGAGHGDPLFRDPAVVAADVRGGRLSRDDAARLYGVVLGDGGEAVTDATGQLRTEVRRGRLERLARRPETRLGSAGPAAAHLGYAIETVELVDVDGTPRLACAGCRELLGDPATGYRGGCGWHETELAAIDPAVFLPPRAQVDTDLVLRHYTCPECGSFLDSDVCRPDDPGYQDVEIFTTKGV